MRLKATGRGFINAEAVAVFSGQFVDNAKSIFNFLQHIIAGVTDYGVTAACSWISRIVFTFAIAVTEQLQASLLLQCSCNHGCCYHAALTLAAAIKRL